MPFIKSLQSINGPSMKTMLAVVLAVFVPGCSATTDSPEVTLEKANMLADRGRFDDAIPVYTKALELFPQRADVYFRRGVCYENIDLPEKALLDYSKCLELDPQFTDAINNKGVILAKLGRFADAIHEFTLLVNQYPENALARRNRGLCHHDLGQFDAAIADYNKAIELVPDDAQSWFQLGNVYLEQEKLEEAINSYNKAISLDAEFSKAWMNRGVAKYSLGQKPEALADLQQARLLNDNIVIPGIDWANAASEADVVVVAKPVIPELKADDWEACMALAKHELLDRNFASISVQIAYADLRCGILDADKDGTHRQIVVGVKRDPSATDVDLPAATSNTSPLPTSLLLLVYKPAADDPADGTLEVASFTENWNPATTTSKPVLLNVSLPVE